MKLQVKNREAKALRNISDGLRFAGGAALVFCVVDYVIAGSDYLSNGTVAHAETYRTVLASSLLAMWTLFILSGAAGLLAWLLAREQIKLNRDEDDAYRINAERRRNILRTTVASEIDRRYDESHSKAG